jgi:hypothetical protein
MEKRQLAYEGIDFWNRPIFVDANGNRFGNVDTLFNHDASFEEVTEQITEDHIYYFGTEVDCDPMGTKIDPNKIVLVKILDFYPNSF